MNRKKIIVSPKTESESRIADIDREKIVFRWKDVIETKEIDDIVRQQFLYKMFLQLLRMSFLSPIIYSFTC